MNKNERLSDIIGKCDDEFITKASVDATPIAKRRFSVAPFAAAAACVCLVGGGVFAYSQSIKDKNPQSSASSENELIAQQDSSQNAIEIAPEDNSYTESYLSTRIDELYNYKAQLEEELSRCHAEFAETEDEAKQAELSEQITAKSEELRRIEAEIADYERQLYELTDQHNVLGITAVDAWNALSGYWYNAEGRYCNFEPQSDDKSLYYGYFDTAFLENSTAEDKTAYFEVGSESDYFGTEKIYTRGDADSLGFSSETTLTAKLIYFWSFDKQDSVNCADYTVDIDFSQFKDTGKINVIFDFHGISFDYGEFVYGGKTEEEANSNYVNGTNAEPDIYQEPQWEDKNFYQQFPCFNFNNIAYVAAGETYAEIGEKLGTATANNVDIYTGTDFNVELEIFEVISVDRDYAVAVKTLDGFYGIYTNCDYATATFGDMVEGLNLEENLQFGSCGIQTETDMTASYSNILNTDDEAIWEFLSDCYDAQSVGDYTEFSDEVFMDESDILDDYVSFAVASEVLAFENLSFRITKGGYITTNIMSTGRAFYIGVDKANELAQMLEESPDAETVVGDKIPMFDDDDADNTETKLTLPYAPIDDSQSATLIAEFKEQMGEAPLNLTTDQANSILQKISGLVLCKVDDASEIEFPTGGGIIFEIVGGNRYNIIGENILWYNGDYYLIENDTTALISELTSLLGGITPVQDHNFEAEIVEVYENNSVLLECISSSETGIVGVGDQITANLPQGSTVAVGDIVSVNYDGNIGETYPMILLGHYTITVVE